MHSLQGTCLLLFLLCHLLIWFPQKKQKQIGVWLWGVKDQNSEIKSEMVVSSHEAQRGGPSRPVRILTSAELVRAPL